MGRPGQLRPLFALRFRKIGRPDPDEQRILARVEELTRTTDLDPEDHFFNRLALAGFGSVLEIEERWTLAKCVKAHQELDLQAETERIAHRMNRPKAPR